MSKTQFKPIVIGRKSSLEEEHKRNLDAKRSDLRELKEYASRFIDVESYDILEKDFLQTFKKRFTDKFASQFPTLVNQSKQLEMVDCDISKIDTLSNRIEANKTEIDAELNHISDIDYNIYTTDENQNLLFKALQRISDDYCILKKNGLQIFPMAICNGTQQALKYDFKTQRMHPNIHIFNKNFGR